MQEKYIGSFYISDDSGSMTEISRKAYDIASSLNLPAAAAADALLSEVPVRRFADILSAFLPDRDLRTTLVNGLCENDAGRIRASVEKKVRAWLDGKYQPTKREDLLELCFVLGLRVDKADAFLAMAGEEGLHWRDPHELVYAYALRKGKNYPQARELLQRILPEQELEEEPESRKRKTEKRKNRDDRSLSGKNHTFPESFTPLVYKEVSLLNTEEELKQYIRQASDRLGTFHNSAYQQFMDFMQMLEQPGSFDWSEDKRYSTRDIIEQYLNSRLPSTRQGKMLSEKHSGILSGWPDEVMLSKMKNRRIDVTRKVLILLFLATDGMEDGEEEDWDVYAYTDSAAEADADFRSSYVRMNQMLAACGYRMLDPRNPFDWIVIYCMRVSDDSANLDGLTERLADVLQVLFPDSGSEESAQRTKKQTL